MKDLYPYSLGSLEEMFSLRKGDIKNLINSEGVPIYSALRSDYVGYLPSLGSAFKLDYETERIVSKNVTAHTMILNSNTPVISIETRKKSVPPSSYLYRNVWLPAALELLDVTDNNFLLLVSRNIDVPVFCGHERLIKRLALNSDNNIKIMKVNKFVKEGL